MTRSVKERSNSSVLRNLECKEFCLKIEKSMSYVVNHFFRCEPAIKQSHAGWWVRRKFRTQLDFRSKDSDLYEGMLWEWSPLSNILKRNLNFVLQSPNAVRRSLMMPKWPPSDTYADWKKLEENLHALNLLERIVSHMKKSFSLWTAFRMSEVEKACKMHQDLTPPPMLL